MKDEDFITERIQKGRQAKDKLRTEFAGISEEQLNWKPSPDKWSIGQCLEHLINSDSSYFPIFREINDGEYKMGFWAKYSPFTRMFGNSFRKQMDEVVKLKLKAPKNFQPAKSNLKLDVIDHYEKNLDTFLDLISKCKDVDLDKTVIISPVATFVTYDLRDTLYFLVQHEHRHLNQAMRVKADERFPRL